MKLSLPAVAGRQLISDEYRQLNAELHSREVTYGTTGRRYVDVIRELARKYNARVILDYGCGKQDLSKALSSEFKVHSYDPALPGLDAPPEPADLVACIDVLEHVQPECLENVLLDLTRVTLKIGFFTIATGPSGKQLADGSNCHRIVRNSSWWIDRSEKYFRVIQTNVYSGCLQVLVEPS